MPDETKPVVAGRLQVVNGKILFNYGRSYLERISTARPAISIYAPELPLKSGVLPLAEGLVIPGCIRDAAPDTWGRRVIINKVLGLKVADVDTLVLDELTYLVESGSDRTGALDFQLSPTEYVPRVADNPSLEELFESSERIEKGKPLTPALDQALFHASSIGGARPKALIEIGDTKYIAKFSSSSDLYAVVKGEYIAMRLASIAGLDVPPVQLTKAVNKDVLLIKRFDRVPKGKKWARKAMVSALTLLGLDEMMARYASYEDFAEIIRYRFTSPKRTLEELFSRLVFNILCGNTDDHARNHAAFWDGNELTLTPAYDICPQLRSGNEASQGMLIAGSNNLSQLKTCLESAHNFHLSNSEARSIFEKQIAVIEQNWDTVCEEAELSEVGRNLLWRRQFLNAFSIEQ